MGISRQRAHFHYKRHLLAKNLIEGYEIFVMRYGESPSVMAYFTVSFHDYDTFARFSRSLLDKFFVVTMGKILGKDALIFEVFLPIDEFRTFVDALSTLARMRLLRRYRYAIQDLSVRSRQTFSGEYFKDGSWHYDHKKHLENLRQKASNSS